MLTKWLCLPLAAAAFTSLAIAGEVEIQARGTGMNRDSAIEQALVHAVRQVNGLNIKSRQVTDDSSVSVNGEADLTEKIDRQVLLDAKGQVAGYGVVSENCVEHNCDVELSVRIYKFETPGLPTDGRRRIAVLPFTGGKEFRKMVTHQVQEQLVQSRRFAVLDREHDKEYQNEKSLWQSGDVSVAERARLGQMLGLDYIVVGQIEKAGVNRWQSKVSLTGETKNYVRSFATVRYQIIAVATRQVKWSDTVSVTLDNVGSLERTASAASKKIAGGLLENIYPLRVVALNNGQIILNQGGKTIQVGSHYKIFSLGEEIIDPYTNESLGRSESKAGLVRIVRVEAKMSYAEVVNGSLVDIQPGFIARPGKSIAPKPARTESRGSTVKSKSDVVVPTAGGVIL